MNQPKAPSILIPTPFRKRFGDCVDNPPLFDIVEYAYFAGTARLWIRLFLGDRREMCGVSKIRLFGRTWAAWGWKLSPDRIWTSIYDYL